MRINWKRFWVVFALCNVIMFLNGCTASWIGAIQGLMPAIGVAINAIFALITALTGKTVPTSVTDFVQKVETAVSAGLTEVSNILSTITTNASQTVLAQIESVFQSIISSLNTLLPGLNITDTSTIGKIENLVSLAVAAVEAVLVLIPLAMKAETLNEAEQVHADKAATNSIKNTHKVLQSTYHAVVSNDNGTKPTDNADVNLALANLTQTLP